MRAGARLHLELVGGRRGAGGGEGGALQRAVHLPAVQLAVPAHERGDRAHPRGHDAGQRVERLGLLGHQQ